VQILSPAQAREDVFDDDRVGVHIGDRPTNVFFFRIPE
jgi:hypothetical protein